MHTHHHNIDETNINENYALLKYMAAHNSAHTEELVKTAQAVKQLSPKAYEKLQVAIESYRNADSCLKDALSLLETEE